MKCSAAVAWEKRSQMIRNEAIEAEKKALVALEEQKNYVSELQDYLAQASARQLVLEEAYKNAQAAAYEATQRLAASTRDAQDQAARKEEAAHSLTRAKKNAFRFSSALASRSLKNFSIEDVGWLLRQCGHVSLVETIAENKVDGSVLRELSDEDLERLGMTPAAERKYFLYTLRLIEACGELELPEVVLQSFSEDLHNKSADAVECPLWGPDKVAAWLKHADVRQEVVGKLEEGRVTGRQLLFLTERDLGEFGVTTLGERKRIAAMCRDLREAHFHMLAVMSGNIEEESSEVQSPTSADQIPREYFCPLSLKVMNDPVLAEDGYIYERSAIEQFLDSLGVISPMTGQPMGDTLKSCVSLRNAISAYLASHAPKSE
eukprot:m51a1_g650 hypothetical protein (376) ;mRNA; f:201722-202849